MHVPMTTLIVQAHFKVRECALMMCMVLGGISDDIITGTTDHISHSMKVQVNSVCICYISLLRDMSNYNRDSNNNSDLEHTSEYGSKMPPTSPPSPSLLPQLSLHHALCQSLSCKIGSNKILRHCNMLGQERRIHSTEPNHVLNTVFCKWHSYCL